MKDAAKLIGAVGAHVSRRHYSYVSSQLLKKICRFNEVWVQWKRDRERGSTLVDGHKTIDGKKYPHRNRCLGNWVILNACDWFRWSPGGASKEGIGGTYDPDRTPSAGGGGGSSHPPIQTYSAGEFKARQIILAATLYHEFLHCIQGVDPENGTETHEERTTRMERETNKIHAEIYRKEVQFICDAVAACEVTGAELDWLNERKEALRKRAKDFDQMANK